MLRRLIIRRAQRNPFHTSGSINGIRGWEAPQYYIYGPTIKRPSIHQKKNILLPSNSKHSRTLFTSSIPPLLLPPVIFIGLLLGLWTWKCFWIIVMQNKLLYLSWLPPFSRSDKISEYESECKPVRWQEKRIRSLDGTKLAVCEGHIPVQDQRQKPIDSREKMKKKSVVICYFQGNGGSTPLRLPLLSQVLRTIATKSQPTPDDPSYSIVALSYRGYWTSSGRATQSGIELDAQAFLNWVSETYSAPDTDLQIILWGHSLGCAVASSALSSYLTRRHAEQSTGPARLAPIAGLILEAPISSIKDMLIGLYPQKWLPYRYLWPFSWNTWCTATALEQLADYRDRTAGDQSVPPILILSPEQDEVVPPEVAGRLESRGHDLGLDIARKDVPRAMHIEAPIKIDGREALVHTTTGCGEQGFPSAQPYLSHTPAS
ncbi:hypothetical protein NUU61_009076 [Penicillium alfredii]|uniref:AB hydrolase-1 domain-containing protein n=1 Tax=Penicillium alfredii TaxID=1506179 RepID=A0A9W9JXB1_9EURO|nr:uncharacterized protein NUU61_009076 [Penicillium alfredii]KAJ5084497.1 hypothetical protein NUU61_009076 [Penicillium alfredii]